MAKFGVNGAFLDISIQGASSRLEVDMQHFERFVQVQDYALPGKPNIGIALPTAELCFTHSDVKAVTGLLAEKEIKVNVAISTSQNQLGDVYKYKATNFDIQFIEGTLQMTMFLIIDLYDFIIRTDQRSYKDKTLLEVIKDIKTIKTEIEPKLRETDDKMTWLQFGVSDYQFLAESVRHAKLKDPTDLLLTAINKDELTVTTYNEIIKKPNREKVYMSQTADQKEAAGYRSAYSCSKTTVETSIGVYQYMLSVETIPVLKVLDDETDADKGLFSSFFRTKGKTVNPFTSDRVQAPKLDCGNTHNDYWVTQLANEKKIANIYRNLIYLDTVNQLTPNLKLLDAVEYRATSASTGVSPGRTVLDGTYCVFGISRYIGKQTCSSRVTIAKAEY